MKRTRINKAAFSSQASSVLPWAMAGLMIGAGAVALSYLGPKSSPSPRSDSAALSRTASNDNSVGGSSVKESNGANGTGFAPTLVNKSEPTGIAPEGMVWIPGGEFSMGSDHRSESLCGLRGVTNDAVQIGRAHV